MVSEHPALLCRFLAEVPDAFSQRVQKLLPMLLTVHSGEGIPFLLPALLQVLDGESSDAEGQAGWVTALLQQQVSTDLLQSSTVSARYFQCNALLQDAVLGIGIPSAVV